VLSSQKQRCIEQLKQKQVTMYEILSIASGKQELMLYTKINTYKKTISSM
jgi:hypothetical protein